MVSRCRILLFRCRRSLSLRSLLLLTGATGSIAELSIGLALGLFLALGTSESHGQWTMRIHKGEVVEEHALAEVDSLT